MLSYLLDTDFSEKMIIFNSKAIGSSEGKWLVKRVWYW